MGTDSARTARAVLTVTSVVIAAHDEAAVLGRTLASLGRQGLELDVTVVANACTDSTAQVARAHGARVIETPHPGKAAALNLGDAVASGFPRVYLDADIVVPDGAVADLVATLQGPDAPLAVAPARRLEASGRPWPVRAYSAVNERLPAFSEGLVGRGLVVVSATGRARFGEFPLLVADDLFLDSQFTTEEKRVVDTVEVGVETPWRTRDLLRRLVRVRQGNARMRHAGRTGEVAVDVRPADRLAWLRAVRREPRLAPAGVVYAAISSFTALRARRAAVGWGRDESTRAS